MSTTPSTSTTLRPNNRILLVAGAGVLIVGGAAIYLYRRNRRTQSLDVGKVSVLHEAEERKAKGIEAFRNKRYEEATQLFTDSIDRLEDCRAKLTEAELVNKSKELLSSCENNIAACYDALGETLNCLDHCSAAIAIKPDYTKALIRRARCFFKLGKNSESIEDYLDVISMEGPDQSQQTMATLQNEIDRVADAMIIPEMEKIFEKRDGVPLKIPQTAVVVWLQNTVTNDPILLRTQKLDVREGVENVGLDEALAALRKGQYETVASLATQLATNEDSQDPIEKALATLLASRFLHYQGLKDQAKKMAQQFVECWEKIEEKLTHKDLHVAHIALQLSMTDLDEENLGSVSEASKQQMYQLMEEGLRINPKNSDPLMVLGVRLLESELHEDALVVFQRVKKLDPRQPYVKFYELYTNFLLSLRSQIMSQVHAQILQMERAIQETEKPPVFALLMQCKIGMLMQNGHIAVDSVKKALTLMPNCAYAVYLLGLLDQQGPEDLANRERFAKYMLRVERAMRKAIEIDPNYWEPYRMLAKIRMDGGNYTEADKHYEEAIGLVRNKDELMVLLKERMMLIAIWERKRMGKAVPKAMAAM